jgi:hypothetical protein
MYPEEAALVYEEGRRLKNAVADKCMFYVVSVLDVPLTRSSYWASFSYHGRRGRGGHPLERDGGTEP